MAREAESTTGGYLLEPGVDVRVVHRRSGSCSSSTKIEKGGVQGVPKWFPSPDGFAKLNIDAALSKNENKATVAAIARDGSGSFLGASVLVVNGGYDPEILEAAACREGLALASDLNLHHLRLASDYANAVNTIKRGESLSSYGQLIKIKEVRATAERFLAVEFVHENRQSNT
jgi:hypothetical protein